MKNYYPGKPELPVETIHLHSRHRVVVDCFDKDQADRIATQVSKFCSCQVENVAVAFTDDGAIRGEYVGSRRNVLLDAVCPSDGEDA